MVNFRPLTAGIGWRVWGTPANFNGFRVLASLLYTDVAQRRSTKLCTMFGCFLGWYIMYAFWGLLPLTEFCQVQYSLCVQVLRCSILAALLHGTRAVGVSQALRCGIFTRQGSHPVRHWAVELSSWNIFVVLSDIFRSKNDRICRVPSWLHPEVRSCIPTLLEVPVQLGN